MEKAAGKRRDISVYHLDARRSLAMYSQLVKRTNVQAVVRTHPNRDNAVHT